MIQVQDSSLPSVTEVVTPQGTTTTTQPPTTPPPTTTPGTDTTVASEIQSIYNDAVTGGSIPTSDNTPVPVVSQSAPINWKPILLIGGGLLLAFWYFQRKHKHGGQ